ncbi:MAG: YigZ family protein [Dinghuibacter sp.]|nr:YigZ family protein [Dinghuibacter sp.]
MNHEEFYYTVEQTGAAEYKDRGSRFIGIAYPVNDAADVKKYLQEVKKEHPKATHHCFAWRLGTDKNQFRVSDDGEPSGTAGRPILGQIDSKGVTNILVVVVRYFGGTLLGAPGLINAYKSAAALCLQVVPIVQKNKTRAYRLRFDYTQMNEIMRVVKQVRAEITAQEQALFSSININVSLAEEQRFLVQLENLRGVEVEAL